MVYFLEIYQNFLDTPKPKSKKQLQAEQRRRELEMASIAKELEEKKKKEEEKEQERKKQEQERKKQMEEEKKKNEEDQRRIQTENRKKKEREEKEREQRALKERDRVEKVKKSQEEEQRRKEEEKRRKAEEKAAKQKSTKDTTTTTKERDEKEKIQQQTKPQKARTVPQYQQQSQQQSKYPREVPPRFLRQQQMKQNRTTTKDSTSNSDNYYDNSNNSNYRDHHHHHNTNGWTEIAPSNTVASSNSTSRNNFHHSEDWDLEIDYKPSNSTTVTATDLSLNSSSNTSKSHNVGVIGQPIQTSTNISANSWGGIPASEDWDQDMRTENGGQSRTTQNQISSQSSTTVIDDSCTKMNSVVKNLFNSSTNGQQLQQSKVDMVSSNGNTNSDPSWGVSLTGSTWETVTPSAKQWDSVSDNSKTSMNEEKPPVAPPEQSSKLVNSMKENLSAQPRRNGPDGAKQNSSNYSTTSSNPPPPTRNVLENSSDNVRTASPGITSWAGLDSFDAGPAPSATVSYNENTSNQERPSGTKPKHSNVSNSNNSKSNGHHSKEHLTNGSVNKALSSVNNRVDTNSKVSGWLQSTSPQTENWSAETHKTGEEDFGWTTVAKPSKKDGRVTTSSAPNTPSKQDGSNAWTNRALKQLLDMGFQREEAEKALKDNNGIIESAVSDLLMKADKPPELPLSAQSASSSNSNNKSSSNKSKPNNNSSSNDPTLSSQTKPDITSPTNVTLVPQKLNRKQRRKLQQMQNAESQKATSPTNSTSSQPKVESAAPAATSTTSPQDNSVKAPGQATAPGLKYNGDGLLPTPPASYRIMSENQSSTTDSLQDKIVGRPLDNLNGPNSDSVGVIQKPRKHPGLIGQENKQSSEASAKLPIGSSRPSQPNPIQPPPSSVATQQQQQSTSNELPNKMSNSDLQPPVNPILLAQMHFQKLGLSDTPPTSSNFSATSAPASSQTVTNSYIQQYLQQMNKSSSEANTSSIGGSSSISTPLLATSSMSLSSLLPQPPVPANSLSDGPQKSKLLQWTQPSSAGNSEPTTPPSSDEKDKSLPPQKVDPVSAKWGVIAAPRLSPTPAEFKPGVPWRPRGGSMADADDLDDCDDDLAKGLNPSEIPQSSFATKLFQQQQQQEKLELEARLAAVPGAIGEQKMASGDYSWVLLKGFPPMMDANAIRSACQHFGTLLQFKAVPGMACAQYETVSIAKQAAMAMTNPQITALQSNEQECMSVIESQNIQPVQPPPPAAQPSFSSMGGLWGTPAHPTQAPPVAPFVQQSFAPPSFGGQVAPGPAPTSIGMNGAFNHWGLPATAQPPMVQSSQLWGPGPGPQQPTANAFPGYNPTGWLQQSKPVEPIVPPSTGFGQNVDHCLPSELLNNFTREQGS
ncbi:capping protein inhibiting regulator of actin dynamics-like isoform X2 [Clytia hemisphaerica]|uniref:capping protein inhibiting regulator of actin dynamics-like isoform X2 n=1 Tax=Clytia hemisphaerica TaxID=252671 RepID=UPI0034D5DE2A